ncbi:MAG TPA: GyrI-like domain-containing protein [Anaerolineaceae bacterium]|nr:GyrI-like domain-containing protein [Anaerolineaceae bacterium]HPN53253.1 GyrI-like domain-containing protein [Anaerolineaceae bacterium]
MSELNVRMVKLEAMDVYAAHGFGPEPEGLAWQAMTDWMKKNNVSGPQRFFGFNNPNPTVGSPNYGYEVWMAAGESTLPEGDLERKHFDGGLYAVAHCKGVEAIPGVWRELVAWRENSPYKSASHQWLEEHFNTNAADVSEWEFDLYMPVK